MRAEEWEVIEAQRIEIEGTWEEIAAHAPEFAGRRVRLLVLPEDGNDDGERGEASTLKEKIAAIVAQVPEEEWSNLPADMGDNLDHYVYGTPKQG